MGVCRNLGMGLAIVVGYGVEASMVLVVLASVPQSLLPVMSIPCLSGPVGEVSMIGSVVCVLLRAPL